MIVARCKLANRLLPGFTCTKQHYSSSSSKLLPPEKQIGNVTREAVEMKMAFEDLVESPSDLENRVPKKAKVIPSKDDTFYTKEVGVLPFRYDENNPLGPVKKRIESDTLNRKDIQKYLRFLRKRNPNQLMEVVTYLFSVYYELDSEFYSKLINGLLKTNDNDKAFEIYKLLKNEKPNLIDYTKSLKHDPKAATKCISAIEAEKNWNLFQLDSRVFTKLFREKCNTQSFEDILFLYKSSSIELRNNVGNLPQVLIYYHLQNNDVESAKSIHFNLVLNGKKVDSMYSYALMEYYYKTNKLKSALNIFEFDDQLKGSIASLKLALKICQDFRVPDLALKYFNESIKVNSYNATFEMIQLIINILSKHQSTKSAAWDIFQKRIVNRFYIDKLERENISKFEWKLRLFQNIPNITEQQTIELQPVVDYIGSIGDGTPIVSIDESDDLLDEDENGTPQNIDKNGETDIDEIDNSNEMQKNDNQNDSVSKNDDSEVQNENSENLTENQNDSANENENSDKQSENSGIELSKNQNNDQDNTPKVEKEQEENGLDSPFTKDEYHQQPAPIQPHEITHIPSSFRIKTPSRFIPNWSIEFANDLIHCAPDEHSIHQILKSLSFYQIQPTQVTFNILLNRTISLQPNEPFLSRNEFSKFKKDARSYDIMINSYQNPSEMLIVWNEMLENQITPLIDTFHTLMKKFINTSDPSSFKDFFSKFPSLISDSKPLQIVDFIQLMKSFNIQVNLKSHQCVLEKYFFDKQFSSVIDYFNSQIDKSFDLDTHSGNLLIQSYLHTNDSSSADKIYNLMLERNITNGWSHLFMNKNPHGLLSSAISDTATPPLRFVDSIGDIIDTQERMLKRDDYFIHGFSDIEAGDAPKIFSDDSDFAEGENSELSDGENNESDADENVEQQNNHP